jgi:hypothetical protein
MSVPNSIAAMLTTIHSASTPSPNEHQHGNERGSSGERAADRSGHERRAVLRTPGLGRLHHVGEPDAGELLTALC